MAKSKTANIETGEGESERLSFATLGGTLKRAVTAMQKPIEKLVSQFAEFRDAAKPTWPKVAALYAQVLTEHPSATFVEFVRLFAPDMPTHAADRESVPGYRNHKVYYTLNYMKRTWGTKRRGAAGGVRATATVALASMIKTVLAVVSEPAPVWAAIQERFSFTEREMNRLKKRVAETQPVFEVKLPAKAHIKIGKVIHMQAPAEAAAAAEGEPMRQAGRAVRRSA